VLRMLAGLLAAVCAVASGLAGLAHGSLIGILIGWAAVAAGALAYLTAPEKKTPRQDCV